MTHTAAVQVTVLPPHAGERMTGLPRHTAMTASLAGALMLPLAFPDRGWWPLAFVGVALILWGVRGQKPGFASLLGFASGFAFYLAHVFWTSLFLGPVPWIALCTLMGFWWAAAFPLIALAYRRLPSRPGPLRAYGALPLAVASIWTLREALSSTVPYGGFAWGRLAQSQSDSPFVELVSWFGLSGLSFAMVWVCAFAIELLAGALSAARPLEVGGRRGEPRAARSRGAESRAVEPLVRVGIIALTLSLLATWPLWPTQSTGSVRILAVQGDTPGASYFIPSERGEILMAHADETFAAQDRERIDLILWPEGSVDVSPWYSETAAEVLDQVSEYIGAPLLANTVTMDGEFDAPGTHYFNTQFLWEPGAGAVSGYDKAHPIPFGEYVPDREFFMALAPDLIRLIQREYTPGTRSNVIEASGTKFGVFICYDIVDDALIRAAIDDSAEVLLAPTNNADFGMTDESGQQIATARLRAVETGRSVVQASTVGWSAAYLPSGEEIAALDWYEPGSFTAEVPTASGTTLAMSAGRHFEIFLAGLGLAFVLASPRATPREERPRRYVW
ncbi:apolipoprotein N-acyltransferase [Gulosibacter molinativorax]|uniref:Apolipoprotein N-acyltransferase n=1 Tax=Gulosibacter molinativorax TaxID=256821 RepID=A0ABT7C4K4_9MICO|nr:apolipoprotein N-acyltransferase [Gulosibacter molinativorax]MDJ1370142.1 apolipoprotein N-acyltransferase [Gulosibacter molinativorax]QUY61553.1 Apolipoprotein N-acyltransferase [Gulosibacter molinativorax]